MDKKYILAIDHQCGDDLEVGCNSENVNDRVV